MWGFFLQTLIEEECKRYLKSDSWHTRIFNRLKLEELKTVADLHAKFVHFAILKQCIAPLSKVDRPQFRTSVLSGTPSSMRPPICSPNWDSWMRLLKSMATQCATMWAVSSFYSVLQSTRTNILFLFRHQLESCADCNEDDASAQGNRAYSN